MSIKKKFTQCLAKADNYSALLRLLEETQLQSEVFKLSRLIKKYNKELAGFFEKSIRIGVISDSTYSLIEPALITYAASKKINLTLEIARFGEEMEVLHSENSYFFQEVDLILVAFTHNVLKRLPVSLKDYFLKVHEHFKQGVLAQTIPLPVDTIKYDKDLSTFNSFLRENFSSSIVDIERLANLVGLESWFDESKYFLAKTPFSSEYSYRYSKLVIRRVGDQLGKVKKCLVLDLDNTLWGGVIGDDGLDGIKIGEGSSLGEAYLAFQKLLKSYKDQGVILAVCSKNEIENATLPFEKHEDMFLHLEDFSAFKANWNDKATNLIELASELNLGLDSFVFIDDNPAEREVVKSRLPMVDVLDLPPDPALYCRTLLCSFIFDHNRKVTLEDSKKADLYMIKKEAEKMSANFSDYDDYLASLKMLSKVEDLNEDSITRFSQILGKTNQFNTTGKRYSVVELRGLLERKDYKLMCFRLIDRFGDHGIVSAVILKKDQKNLEIENWVMSCRVFKRGFEKFIFNTLLTLAKEYKFSSLGGQLIPINKNKYVHHLYRDLGFTEVNEGIWRLNIKKAQVCKTFIGKV